MSQPDIFARLAAPFPPHRIHWRVGATTKDKTKGMALAFIDARDVMERLDDVAGPGGWTRRHPHANGKTTCCIALKIDGEWVEKEDGAGDTDVEAEKGSLSDSFKRAAVNWGIGRYLYDLDAPWVKLEDGKRIADSEYERLHTIASGARPPAPKPAAKPTLSERAAAFEAALIAATTTAARDAAWSKGMALRSELDKSDPERLAELQAAYDAPISKKAA